MKFYELKITLSLNINIHCEDMIEKLSIMFNKSMLYDKELKLMHKCNAYKLYTFEGLSPFERDKIYKSGRLYMTRLRSIDKYVAQSFRYCLKKTKTNEFSVLSVDMDEINFKHIDVLFNVTPAIAIIENKPWVENMGLEIVKKSINDNLLKKIKSVQKIDDVLEHDMIKSIALLNKKSIACKYKKVKLLGNKFKVFIKDDDMSQYMANMALAVGLLEKNSLGYGYCLYKNIM